MARVVHFEIQADDIERAKTFYSSALGWEFTPWGDPAMYWLITTGPDSERGIDGGLMQRMRPIDGQGVIAFVCTATIDNLDAYTTRVTNAGGIVAVPKMPIPTMGWLTYFKDTEGNLFGLMQVDPAAA